MDIAFYGDDMRKRKSIFKYKIYAHFDKRIEAYKIKRYINDSEKVKTHAFLPFVLDTQKHIKFDKEKYKLLKSDAPPNNINGVTKPKKRKIMFSAHIDRYIYQLYNYKLNKFYNGYVKNNGINKCSIAYRTNFNGKSNIDFARDVFEFILKTNNSYIMVGDFKDFFENLDHKYLKKMMCKVMDCKALPDDYYAVYKNITRYRYFDIKDICQLKRIKKGDIYKHYKDIDDVTGEIKTTFEMEKLLTIEEMKKNTKQYLRYNEKRGIPQGSAISSVLSNIYMIDADKRINDYVASKQGLYRRYSDDFIIIIPAIEKEEFAVVINEVNNMLKMSGNPEPKEEKTRVYYYEKEKLINVDMEFLTRKVNTKDELEYLGFAFTGNKIRIRAKTMTKYYYRMYKKIKTIAKMQGVTKKGNKISGKELYRLYSKYGKNDKRGNFITYNEKCERKFRKLKKYYVSYKERFLSKLKNRYRNEMARYKEG